MTNPKNSAPQIFVTELSADDTENVIGQIRPQIDATWEKSVLTPTGPIRVVTPDGTTYKILLVPVKTDKGRMADLSLGSIEGLDVSRFAGERVSVPVMTLTNVVPVQGTLHAVYSKRNRVEGKDYPKGLKAEVVSILENEVPGDLTKFLKDGVFVPGAFNSNIALPPVTSYRVKEMSDPNFLESFIVK